SQFNDEVVVNGGNIDPARVQQRLNLLVRYRFTQITQRLAPLRSILLEAQVAGPIHSFDDVVDDRGAAPRGSPGKDVNSRVESYGGANALTPHHQPRLLRRNTLKD